jgi:nucleoside-diphosphate-sugar epimerase
MKVLILGSEGTLGCAVCKNLEKNNIEIIRWDIKLGEEYDLRKEGSIDEILKEVDYVLFLAFDVGGAKYHVNNKDFIDNNMKIILYTFDSLYKSDKPFIYTTSCMSNMLTNPYGVLKNISEHYVNLKNGINIKLWNVYGNEEVSDKSHVIPDFIYSAIKNKHIKIKTDGSESRQFLHCDDFSEAIYLIMNNHNTFYEYVKQTDHKTIDITSYVWTSIHEISLEIKEFLYECYNIDIDIVKGDAKDSHTHVNIPTTSILNDMWEPKILIKDGLKNIIQTNYDSIISK